jgi:hypothetical protein
MGLLQWHAKKLLFCVFMKLILNTPWYMHTTTGLCFLCVVYAKWIWENIGMGTDFIWSSKGTAVGQKNLKTQCVTLHLF